MKNYNRYGVLCLKTIFNVLVRSFIFSDASRECSINVNLTHATKFCSRQNGTLDSSLKETLQKDLLFFPTEVCRTKFVTFHRADRGNEIIKT